MDNDETYFILLDPLEMVPVRGEQELKDVAFSMSKEVTSLVGTDIFSEEFVKTYKKMEEVMLRAEKYRPHMYLLALHTVKHLLTTDLMHLSHYDHEDIQDMEDSLKSQLHACAMAIVEMLSQTLFFHKGSLPVLDVEEFQKMPEFLRSVTFIFNEYVEEEEEGFYGWNG